MWLRNNYASAYDRVDAHDTTCRSATADYESEGRAFESFRARQSFQRHAGSGFALTSKNVYPMVIASDRIRHSPPSRGM